MSHHTLKIYVFWQTFFQMSARITKERKFFSSNKGSGMGVIGDMRDIVEKVQFFDMA
jgi:hypothetical protein